MTCPDRVEMDEQDSYLEVLEATYQQMQVQAVSDLSGQANMVRVHLFMLTDDPYPNERGIRLYAKILARNRMMLSVSAVLFAVQIFATHANWVLRIGLSLPFFFQLALTISGFILARRFQRRARQINRDAHELGVAPLFPTPTR